MGKDEAERMGILCVGGNSICAMDGVITPRDRTNRNHLFKKDSALKDCLFWMPRLRRAIGGWRVSFGDCNLVFWRPRFKPSFLIFLADLGAEHLPIATDPADLLQYLST